MHLVNLLLLQLHMLSESWVVKVVMLALHFLAHDSIAHYVCKHFWMGPFHFAILSYLLPKAQAGYPRGRACCLSGPGFVVVVEKLLGARVVFSKLVFERRIDGNTVLGDCVERFPSSRGRLIFNDFACEVSIVSDIPRESHLVFVVDHHGVLAPKKVARPVWTYGVSFELCVLQEGRVAS